MSETNKTYIIAEAACAHNGDMNLARRMIDIAVASGCDCVKFQAFYPDQIPQITDVERAYLEKCQFNLEQFKKLLDYCDNRIDFLLTPFDIPSIQNIVELQLDTIKVPSGRLFDGPFVDAIKATNKKLIISTGMCAYDELRGQKRKFPKDSLWLHCTSSYPTPYGDLNLHVLRGNMFDGLSDHTLNPHVPGIAVACGARIIEKHFTMSRGLPGPDMKVSLEPIELMEMVRFVRDVEQMLGDGKKKIEDSEQAMIYRKVINDTGTTQGIYEY